MRTLLIGLTVAFCFGLTQGAKAERRMFVITGDVNGYGIDRCLAAGDKCGAAAAGAYCRSHEFATAASFHKVGPGDITGAIPNGGSGGCRGSDCDDTVAIVCTR